MPPVTIIQTGYPSGMNGYAVMYQRAIDGVNGRRVFEQTTGNAGADEHACVSWLVRTIGTYWQTTGEYQIVAIHKEDADEMAGNVERTARDAGSELGSALQEVISKVAVGDSPNMAALMALAKVFCSQQGYQGAEAVIAYVQGFGEGFQGNSKSVAAIPAPTD